VPQQKNILSSVAAAAIEQPAAPAGRTDTPLAGDKPAEGLQTAALGVRSPGKSVAGGLRSAAAVAKGASPGTPRAQLGASFMRTGDEQQLKAEFAARRLLLSAEVKSHKKQERPG
jgi:hypothetical protein